MQFLAEQVLAVDKLDVGLVHLDNGLDLLLSLVVLQHLQLVLKG